MALKSSLKYRPKQILRSLRLYGDQAQSTCEANPADENMSCIHIKGAHGSSFSVPKSTCAYHT